MTVQTEPLCTVRLRRDASRAVRLAGGPRGTRAIAPAAEGGRFHGPRLAGTLVTGASGDWATIRDDGSFLIDARLTLLTDDGAAILMEYRGVGALDADGDAWMHVAPVFETGDERYDWLNRLQAVGFGRLDDGEVVYDIHAITGWQD